MKDRNLQILRYGITGGLLLLLGYLADLKSIASHLSGVNLSIYFIAASVFLSIYIWSAFRWKSLISGLGYSIDFLDSVKIIAMSYGFNKILPLNSGDLTRSKLMTRYTEVGSHGKILGAVAMERFLDVLFLGVLTGISSFYILGGIGNLKWILIAASLLITAMIAVRVRNKFFAKITDTLEKFGVPERVAGFLKDGLRGFSEIPRSKLVEVLIWHSLRWFAGIMVLYILAISLGTPLSIAGATLVTGVMSLVAALPITPAGIGPVEALGTGTLIALGLSSGQAAALVVLQRSLGFILMGAIGALVYSLD